MIKLLAVDMDGTCLNKKSEVTDRTMEALRLGAGRGLIIVPTTGRNLYCLPHRLADGILTKGDGEEGDRNRDLYRYVITSNGGRVLDLKKKKTLYRAMLPKVTALNILKDSRDIPLGIASHMNNRYLIQGHVFAWMGRRIYGRDAIGVCCVKDMASVIRKSRHEVEELQLYFAAPGARKKTKRVLRGYSEISAAYSGIYVEIFSKNASKGRALAMLAQGLNIKKEEIACIGDSENDLSMFDVSGLKIAMGNSIQVLKEKADHVVGTNDQDGVAQAIEQYILPGVGEWQ